MATVSPPLKRMQRKRCSAWRRERWTKRRSWHGCARIAKGVDEIRNWKIENGRREKADPSPPFATALTLTAGWRATGFGMTSKPARGWRRTRLAFHQWRGEDSPEEAMLEPGQLVRVNLAGLQAGGVMFQAAVTDAVGHIVKQTSQEPPKYLVKLLFSFRGVSEVEVPAERIHADK